MPDQKSGSGSGLSLQTLLISSLAAAAAATVVPMFWEQGTLIATAMTPVVVALVSEGLRRPVERVSAVAPRVARRTATGAALRRFDPAAARTRDHAELGARGRGPERFEPLPPHQREDAPVTREDDPYGLRAAERRRPRLKIALVTGLLAFVAAAAVVTVSELAIFGGSVSGQGGRTSIFGGSTKKKTEKSKQQQEPTATPQGQSAPSATPTPGATETATPAPTTSPTPAPATPTPGQ
jgi:hypothetical protein